MVQTLPSQSGSNIPSELAIDDVDDLFELPDHESPLQKVDSSPNENIRDVQNDTSKTTQ